METLSTPAVFTRPVPRSEVKVEVPSVKAVALVVAAVSVPVKNPLPATVSVEPGVVVPMPTLPLDWKIVLVPASRAVVPFVVVQNGMYPAISGDDVPTDPLPPPLATIPKLEVETLSTPPLFTRPVPSNEVKVEVPSVKLLVFTFVAPTVVAKKLVEVALPAISDVRKAFVPERFVAKRFVEVAFVARRFVKIPFVPVRFVVN